MKKTFAAVLAVTVLLPSSAAGQQDAIERAAATITQDDYAWRVGVIAHDSMMGRDTPSPGLDKTALWIASEFRRFGLRGGAPDGGFIQRYPLERVALDTAGSSVTIAGNRLIFGRDVIPLFGAPSDLDATGEVVLVSGSGNAQALPSEDIQGKHVFLVPPPNAGGGNRAFFGAVMGVRGAGAASVTVVNSGDDWEAQVRRASRPSVRLPSDEAESGPAGAPILQVRASALGQVLTGRGVDLAALRARGEGPLETQAVSGVTMTLTQRVEVSQTSAPNVVGILDGSDPDLMDEYVVFSGHMDHVGVGTPDENGDSIFNGADDDGSGTIAVVEVAEAMASLPTAPRRSTIFLIVSGEEKGLWGSGYFADNPSVPVEQMVANLNADMVGRNWPDTIVAIGKEHSDLGETLNRVNAERPELRMTAIDDIWPEERFYFRSDHYNFARKGVPILFFFNGTHEDYHGRDDEPENLDTEKAARISRLLFYVGAEVANADERPKWNPESYKQIVSDGP